MTPEGLTVAASPHDAKATLDRLTAAITARGMSIFGRVDHAAGAEQVGMALDPTEVIIFGNPKGGTPLMQANQTVGIDLPLRALVWSDAAGQTWLAYNDPAWIARRHGVEGVTTGPVQAMTAALAAIVKEVVAQA